MDSKVEKTSSSSSKGDKRESGYIHLAGTPAGTHTAANFRQYLNELSEEESSVSGDAQDILCEASKENPEMFDMYREVPSVWRGIKKSADWLTYTADEYFLETPEAETELPDLYKKSSEEAKSEKLQEKSQEVENKQKNSTASLNDNGKENVQKAIPKVKNDEEMIKIPGEIENYPEKYFRDSFDSFLDTNEKETPEEIKHYEPKSTKSELIVEEKTKPEKKMTLMSFKKSSSVKKGKKSCEFLEYSRSDSPPLKYRIPFCHSNFAVIPNYVADQNKAILQDSNLPLHQELSSDEANSTGIKKEKKGSSVKEGKKSYEFLEYSRSESPPLKYRIPFFHRSFAVIPNDVADQNKVILQDSHPPLHQELSSDEANSTGIKKEKLSSNSEENIMSDEKMEMSEAENPEEFP